ncbi:thiosulfate/3-mercaptopyruvate sulfurtransferase [Angomonas deanei]|nr:thiosulfate/3-mercaptopyruvate sulfurtransferase [Angomonas deanei]|eukprot:EPY27068.1 thiosulfate/3-mercaptopyruvate sulfurtransferase [Angomonas deanei]
MNIRLCLGLCRAETGREKLNKKPLTLDNLTRQRDAMHRGVLGPGATIQERGPEADVGGHGNIEARGDATAALKHTLREVLRVTDVVPDGGEDILLCLLLAADAGHTVLCNNVAHEGKVECPLNVAGKRVPTKEGAHPVLIAWGRPCVDQHRIRRYLMNAHVMTEVSFQPPLHHRGRSLLWTLLEGQSGVLIGLIAPVQHVGLYPQRLQHPPQPAGAQPTARVIVTQHWPTTVHAMLHTPLNKFIRRWQWVTRPVARRSG